MALSTNLVRRQGRYCVRMRVPVDLVEALKRGEVWRALGTADPKEAKRLAPEVISAIHNEWDAVRAQRNAAALDDEPSLDADLRAWSQPQEGQLEAATLLEAWFRREVRRQWAFYHGGDSTRAPAIRELIDDIEDADERHQQSVFYGSELAEHDLEVLRDEYLRGDFWRAEKPVTEVVGHLRLKMRENDQRRTILAKEVMVSLSLLATARQLWAEGDVRHAPAWSPNLPLEIFERHGSPSKPVSANRNVTARTMPPILGEALDALAQRYMTERKRSLSPEWLASQRAIVKLFLEHAGERVGVLEVNKRIAREWKERLLLFPSRGTIRGERLSFRQIVERNAVEKLPTLTNRTINKYISAMRSPFRLARPA